MEVRMPMGISFPGRIVRHSTSAHTRKTAPARADMGISFLWSVPNSIRAPWGTTKPTKPITPALYTEKPTSSEDTTR